jgi:hypothetical protein
MKTKRIISIAICLFLVVQTTLNAQDWSLTGNAGTDPTLNFIGTTDAKALKIKTNNQARMYIKSNGDVGVGTTTPSSKFHVNGVITATGGTSDNWNTAFGWGDHSLAGYLTSFTETDPEVGTITNSFIPRWNGTSLVTGSVYDDGTNVGIGTSSPAAKLHVNAGTSLAARINGTNQMYLALDEAGVQKGYIGSYAGAVDDVDFGTNIGNAAGKTHLTIQAVPKLTVAAGGIGIGTTSPTFPLYVTSSTDLRSAYFYNTTSSASPTYGIYAGAFGTGAGDKRGGSFDAVGGTGTNMGIRATASGGATNYAAYFAAGDVYAADNVGIGIDNPSYPLQVSTSAVSRAGHFNNTYNSTTATYGVYANNTTPGTGSGYGVYGSASGADGSNYGVRGFASAGDANYAVYGNASGGSSTTPAYGVYGTASGSENYWAGYFAGTTYSSTLRIGTLDAASGYIVSVGGKVICEEVKVQLEAAWPDYVFDEKYDLTSMDELEKSIKEDKHLPGMPSAKEIEEQKGFLVGDMQAKLLEKVEEQALYILQLKKEINEIKAAVQHK